MRSRASAEAAVARILIAEDEEPSADDEVDLATGDDELGVETAADDGGWSDVVGATSDVLASLGGGLR